MFVKNAWYVASWSEKLKHELSEVTIMNNSLLLYRTKNNLPVALENRCCHRRVPLSLGRLDGNNVECGYHGFTFDPTGACVAIPNQETIPAAARVRSYPTCEKHSLIWVWMGDPSIADENLIPDFSVLTDPNHAWKGDYLYAAAGYRLITDNLNDLSHLAFVHRSTIGNSSTATANLEAHSLGDTVEQVRWMLDVPPPPTYQRLLELKNNIDRWQAITFFAPSCVRIRTGARRESTKEKVMGGNGSLNMFALHAITPETESTSHYFWAQTHDFRIDEPNVTEQLFNDIKIAFSEDLKIFAAQQAAILQSANTLEVSCKADGPQILARRIVDRMLNNEN